MPVTVHRSRPLVRTPAILGRTPTNLVRAAAALAVAVMVSACGPSGPTIAPSSSAASASATPSQSPASSSSAAPSASTGGSPQEQQLRSMAADILAQVSALRGLALEKPVETRVFDQAGLDAYVAKSYQEQTKPADIESTQGTYRRMGLLPTGASLKDLELELLGSQVLGLYDDKTKQLYVVARGDTIGGLEKFTMSHELDHALQDQHFDLAKLLPEDTDLTSDETLARQSVAEGDASLLMTQWGIQHLTPAELSETMQAAADPEQQALLARMPKILVDPLQFPYSAGLQFVLGRWTSGGWSSVDALYARPPVSTSQVLHPDLYASGRQPVKVDLPDDLAARMGDGWTVADTDTLGEYLTSVWLDAVGGSTAGQGAAAAAGWAGDSLAYLTGPRGSDAVVWRTAWDGQAAADRFEAAAGRAVDAIGGSGAPATVVRSGSDEVTLVFGSDRSVVDAAVRATGLRPAG